MTLKVMELTEAVRIIERFTNRKLTAQIARIEIAIANCDGTACRAHCTAVGITSELLTAAHVLKRTADQINVLVHAVAIMRLLPQILMKGERVEAVSLGAGNTGRAFDVETDKRVAEFKFIHWKGGDTIRQNALFKDFYDLAEHPTLKRKELYLLETERPLKFLQGRRAIKSVLTGKGLHDNFRKRYPRGFKTVGAYFAFRRDSVVIIDASPLLPELSWLAEAQDTVLDAASI